MVSIQLSLSQVKKTFHEVEQYIIELYYSVIMVACSFLHLKKGDESGEQKPRCY
jgi:hypothetical protein